MHYGYSDLAGQLRSALDRFEGVRPFPFWAVALLVFAYILLVGPVRLLPGPQGVPPHAVDLGDVSAGRGGDVCGGLGVGHRLKGDEVRTHQAELLDVDVASGRVRGTAWVNVFSPRNESFDLRFRPRLPDGGEPGDTRVLAAWLGLPGSGLGGMNPSGTDPLLHSGEYRFSPSLDAMEGVPIPVWSTKSLTARWTATGGNWPAAELADDGQSLHGSITNPFDFPLEHCVLIYDRWAYDLGTIGPQQAAHGRDRGQTQRTEDISHRAAAGVRREGQVSPGDHALRPVEHRRILHPPRDDVLRSGRRAALHRPGQRLPGLPRPQRPVADRPRASSWPKPRPTPATHSAPLLRDGRAAR